MLCIGVLLFANVLKFIMQKIDIWYISQVTEVSAILERTLAILEIANASELINLKIHRA